MRRIESVMMFEVSSRVIDVNELERRVRLSVLSRNISGEFDNEVGDKSEIASLKEQMMIVHQNLSDMNVSYEIKELPIATKVPVIGGLVIFVKKVYRKLTRWIFSSYFIQQNQFNSATTRTISDMIKVQETIISKLDEMEKHYEN